MATSRPVHFEDDVAGARPPRLGGRAVASPSTTTPLESPGKNCWRYSASSRPADGSPEPRSAESSPRSMRLPRRSTNFAVLIGIEEPELTRFDAADQGVDPAPRAGQCRRAVRRCCRG